MRKTRTTRKRAKAGGLPKFNYGNLALSAVAGPAAPFARTLLENGRRRKRPVSRNLFGFGKRKAAAPGRRTQMTIGEASTQAYKAGQKHGDTGEFRFWLERKKLDDRGAAVVRRLEQRFREGVEKGEAIAERQTETRTRAAGKETASAEQKAAIKQAEKNLTDAQKQLNAAARGGNAQAREIIAGYEAELRRVKAQTNPRGRVCRKNPAGWADIRPGDRVTIALYHGGSKTGRVVMRGPGGWVLNLGGAHGTPGIATPDNTLKVMKTKAGRSPSPGWMSRVNPKRKAARKTNPAGKAPAGAPVSDNHTRFNMGFWDGVQQQANRRASKYVNAFGVKMAGHFDQVYAIGYQAGYHAAQHAENAGGKEPSGAVALAAWEFSGLPAGKSWKPKGHKANPISGANSSGQGYDPDHADTPLHAIILQHGYKYSHSTPIHYRDGVRILHTYKLGNRNVSVEKTKSGYRWEAGKGGSARGTAGTDARKLDTYLYQRRRDTNPERKAPRETPSKKKMFLTAAEARKLGLPSNEEQIRRWNEAVKKNPAGKLRLGDEATARRWVREYGVPLKVAREAFADGRNTYTKAYDWLAAWVIRKSNYTGPMPGGKKNPTVKIGNRKVKVSRAGAKVIRRLVAMDRKAGRKNPETTATDMYKMFHGKDPDSTVTYISEEHEHAVLWGVGDLVQLTVVTLSGKEHVINVAKVPRGEQYADPARMPMAERVVVAADEAGKQLYLVSGDQELDTSALGLTDDDLKDNTLIGVVTNMVYQTEKEFHKFELTNYTHRLGEESGYQPVLVYHPQTPQMEIAGGRYRIERPGIID